MMFSMKIFLFLLFFVSTLLNTASGLSDFIISRDFPITLRLSEPTSDSICILVESELASHDFITISLLDEQNSVFKVVVVEGGSSYEFIDPEGVKIHKVTASSDKQGPFHVFLGVTTPLQGLQAILTGDLAAIQLLPDHIAHYVVHGLACQGTILMLSRGHVSRMIADEGTIGNVAPNSDSDFIVFRSSCMNQGFLVVNVVQEPLEHVHNLHPIALTIGIIFPIMSASFGGLLGVYTMRVQKRGFPTNISIEQLVKRPQIL